MIKRKASCSVLCTLLLLLGLTSPLSFVYGQSDSRYEQVAWEFLENVLEIDLSKYDVWFNNSLVLPTELGFRPRTVDLLYRFRVSGSSIGEAFSVSFTFIDDKLAYCNLYINNTLSSNKVSDDVMSKAKGF